MACCITCIACCACKLCADCMARTVKCCGIDIELRIERLIYAVVFTSVSILGWALGTYLDYDKLDVVADFDSCRADYGDRDNANVRGCYVNLMVSKVMFGAIMWHFLQGVVLICTRYEEDCRTQIQVGWWFPKIVVLGGLVAGAVYIPSNFYIGWNWVSLFGAFFFILVQIYILIVFAHETAKFFLDLARDRPEEGCNPYVALLFIGSIIMYVASLVMSILMYLYFTRKDESHPDYPNVCQKKGLNVFFVTFNIVLSIIASVLSILPAVRDKNENAGLLQSAMLTLYTTYLVFSALVTEPDEWTEGCKSPLSDLASSTSSSTVGQRAVAIIGVIITVIAVCYSTFMSSRESFEKIFTEMCGCCEAGNEDGAAMAGEPVSYNFTLFHLVFVLGSMYVQQLLTNWKTISKLPFDDSLLASEGFLREITVNSGKAAIWIKIVSSWIVFVLYIWSLIAPVLLSDRDFGY